jgi:hypothetical protein
MTRSHRITLLLVATLLGCVNCGNKKDVEFAKHSVYDTDFAVVYNAALDATREIYPNLDDHPGAGAIRTAWHQVQYAENQDDLSNQRTVAQGQGLGTTTPTQAQSAAGMPTRLAYKRYFIRFDVSVGGGRPWRVKVIGHASEWEPGNALPTELHGAAKPPWLEGRTDALTLAIYKKMKPYAVPMKQEEPQDKPEEIVPKTDPKAFKAVPDGAAAKLAEIKDAVVKRDANLLRGLLADDVVWSLGGAPGADTAVAMWQADPEALDTMARLIGGTCGGDAIRVSCPGGSAKPGTWQLVLELRNGAWKVTSFVKAE